MPLFRPFEPNPFRVNAFSLTGVDVTMTSVGDIDTEISGRRQQIEDDAEFAIPLAGGPGYRVTPADLTQNEEVLRDANRRHQEELLSPRQYRTHDVPAVDAFMRQHSLTPKMADRFLSSEPLNAVHLLTAALPEVPVEAIALQADTPPVPAIARVRLEMAAMLVSARSRRG